MPRVPLVLASSSPRRKELLSSLTEEPFSVRPPPDGFVEDSFDGVESGELPARLAALARRKGEAVAEQLTEPSRVLSADTVIASEENNNLVVLGKPAEPDWANSAGEILSRLSGSSHRVLTGVHLQTPTGSASRVVSTMVTFHELSKELVDWYVRTEEPRGKAGAYAIQGLGSVLVSRVEGSLSNVIGLPLEVTRELLNAD